MNTTLRRSERGQVVVLLVLAMVVLLGFTALAVDGSMVYSDRRFAQDGADASSLAGGAAGAEYLDDAGVRDTSWSTNADCSSGNVAPAAAAARTAAIERGADNDAMFDEDISDNDGVATTCGVETITAELPGGGTYTHYVGNYMDVHTLVTRDTNTSFAHFVFEGLLRNTVEAVTRIRPRQPAGWGNAIVALNPDDCQGNQYGALWYGVGGKNPKQTGTENYLRVIGGGVFSNGCMDVDGNVNVTIEGGSVGYFYTGNHNTLGEIEINPSTNGNPDTPTQLADDDANRIPISAFDIIPEPDCNAPGAHIVDQDGLEADQPLDGLYCIDGGLTINSPSESLTSVDHSTNPPTQHFVTLLFRGGGVTINGGTVDLISPSSESGVYTGSAVPGVLIYMPREYYDCANADRNTNLLQINGNAGNNFTGSIIAPCSTVIMNGDAENFAFNSQVIGYNVNFGGSTGTSVVFNSDRQYTRPTFIDFYR